MYSPSYEMGFDDAAAPVLLLRLYLDLLLLVVSLVPLVASGVVVGVLLVDITAVTTLFHFYVVWCPGD